MLPVDVPAFVEKASSPSEPPVLRKKSMEAPSPDGSYRLLTNFIELILVFATELSAAILILPSCTCNFSLGLVVPMPRLPLVFILATSTLFVLKTTEPEELSALITTFPPPVAFLTTKFAPPDPEESRPTCATFTPSVLRRKPILPAFPVVPTVIWPFVPHTPCTSSAEVGVLVPIPTLPLPSMTKRSLVPSAVEDEILNLYPSLASCPIVQFDRPLFVLKPIADLVAE